MKTTQKNLLSEFKTTTKYTSGVPLQQMKIAVDARFLQDNSIPALQDFTTEVLERVVRLHPEHQFIFFVDDVSNGLNPFAQNVTIITITPKPKNLLSYKWWYDVKLPLSLKKFKADVFMGLNGVCSLYTSIPQVLIIHDLAFLQKPTLEPRLYHKQNTQLFIQKAAKIGTLSNLVKQELVKNYRAEKEAILTVGSGINSLFKPLDFQEKEHIKEKYTDGCEFFVFAGGLHPRSNFLNTLKAFSIFKKWQKTNMKLVITGNIHPSAKDDLVKLSTYKYRTEVYLKDKFSTEESAKLIAASYAMIFPSFYEGFGIPVLQAMQCEVPVITSANSSMSEIAADAALYAEPSNAEEIAEQMKKIFKDEMARAKLIEEGKQRVKLFSWDNTSDLIWQLIEQAVSK